MRSRLEEGGRIRSVFVLEIQVEDHTEFLPYFRTSWSTSFRPMRTSRTKIDRSYRDARRLFTLIREMGFKGPIIMFLAKSPEYGQFAAGLLADGSPVEHSLDALEKALET